MILEHQAALKGDAVEAIGDRKGDVTRLRAAVYQSCSEAMHVVGDGVAVVHGYSSSVGRGARAERRERRLQQNDISRGIDVPVATRCLQDERDWRRARGADFRWLGHGEKVSAGVY